MFNTEQLKDMVATINKAPFRIPSFNDINFTQIHKQPIEPYILGLIIGDGGTSMGGLKFTTGDKELIYAFTDTYPFVEFKRIKEYNYTITSDRVVNSFLSESILQLGLKCRSHEKFIPEGYKYTTFNNRVSILQGLIDTDGHIDKRGRVEYSTVSEKLIKDVQFLVLSIGGRGKIQYKAINTYTSPTQKEKKQARPCYRMAIILPKGITPCRLKRKLNRYKVSRADIRRTVSRIEFDRMDDCLCIKVSASSNLYITDNFVVTHNTNNEGGREGIEVARKQREVDFSIKEGLVLKGFIYPKA